MSNKRKSTLLNFCKPQKLSRPESSDEGVSDVVSDVSVCEEKSALRNNVEDEFKQIFKEALNKAYCLGTTITMPRLVKTQTHRINVPTGSIEEYYRCAILLPWIDSLTSAITDRFLKQGHLKKFYLPPPNWKAVSQEEKEQF